MNVDPRINDPSLRLIQNPIPQLTTILHTLPMNLCLQLRKTHKRPHESRRPLRSRLGHAIRARNLLHHILQPRLAEDRGQMKDEIPEPIHRIREQLAQLLRRAAGRTLHRIGLVPNPSLREISLDPLEPAPRFQKGGDVARDDRPVGIRHARVEVADINDVELAVEFGGQRLFHVGDVEGDVGREAGFGGELGGGDVEAVEVAG